MASLLEACEMALQQFEFRAGQRRRGWDLAFLTATLRTAIAEAKGEDLSPEAAGFSEGQAAYIRLTAAAPELERVGRALWADRDAGPGDQSACRRLHDAWRDLGRVLARLDGRRHVSEEGSP